MLYGKELVEYVEGKCDMYIKPADFVRKVELMYIRSVKGGKVTLFPEASELKYSNSTGMDVSGYTPSSVEVDMSRVNRGGRLLIPQSEQLRVETDTTVYPITP